MTQSNCVKTSYSVEKDSTRYAHYHIGADLHYKYLT